MTPLEGLLGGTFDPVHFGHLRLAEEACDALGLHHLRLIPAGSPPHRAAPATPAEHRLAMVQAAVQGIRHFSVDDAEVRSPAPSYTVTTLLRLRQQLGAAQPLVLILGADAFAGLDRWHRWTEIFGLCHIGLATRAGQAVDVARLPPPLATELLARQRPSADALRDSPAGLIVPFDMTPLAISATDIRARLASRRSVRFLLPEAVLDYIEQHHLYC